MFSFLLSNLVLDWTLWQYGHMHSSCNPTHGSAFNRWDLNGHYWQRRSRWYNQTISTDLLVHALFAIFRLHYKYSWLCTALRSALVQFTTSTRTAQTSANENTVQIRSPDPRFGWLPKFNGDISCPKIHLSKSSVFNDMSETVEKFPISPCWKNLLFFLDLDRLIYGKIFTKIRSVVCT